MVGENLFRVTCLYWTRGLHRVEERIVNDKTLAYKPINSHHELSTFSYFTFYEIGPQVEL